MRPPSTRVQNRRGFALVLVIATIAVLLGFWAMAYRETASLIRVESSRLLNETRGRAVRPRDDRTGPGSDLAGGEARLLRQTLTYTVDVLSNAEHKYFTVTFLPNQQSPRGHQRVDRSVTPGSLTANLLCPAPATILSGHRAPDTRPGLPHNHRRECRRFRWIEIETAISLVRALRKKESRRSDQIVELTMVE